MSTTARRYWLKMLRRLGVRNFKATSGLGFPFVCHVGDFAGEVPFYSSSFSRCEIELMAAWCRDIEKPIIFDVGANLGFVATQLAQSLSKDAKIFCFEPVPSTFAKLLESIARLDLEDYVIPLNCAISDAPGILRIAYNPKASLFAQVRNDTDNLRAGHLLAYCPSLTLDNAVESLGVKPHLIKIDVEGFEDRVMRGGQQLLGGPDQPALLFEWNPVTMEEVGTPATEFASAFARWRLYYVDDFDRQRRPFAEEISQLSSIDWGCNIFAIPATVRAGMQWERCVSKLRVVT